jgi:DNA invertase Pin-like site-specific DNA recombinase
MTDEESTNSAQEPLARPAKDAAKHDANGGTISNGEFTEDIRDRSKNPSAAVPGGGPLNREQLEALLAKDGEPFEYRRRRNREGNATRIARRYAGVIANLDYDKLVEAIQTPLKPVEAPMENRVMPAYGYIRVSTEVRAQSGLGMAAQDEAITKYCKWRGLELLRTFTDEAVSGKTRLMSRPGGNELDRVLKRGDHVILAKHDRGFRNTIDMLQTTEAWTARGIVTHTVNWSMDTTQPFWKLFAPIAAAIAEWEGRMIRERVTEALAVRKRQGQRWGRHAPLGFKWIPDPKGGRSKKGHPRKIAAVDPGALADINMIALLYDEKRISSFYEIWRFLFYGKVKRSNGKDWTGPSMIARYYKRYKELKNLMIKEAESNE